MLESYPRKAMSSTKALGLLSAGITGPSSNKISQGQEIIPIFHVEKPEAQSASKSWLTSLRL